MSIDASALTSLQNAISSFSSSGTQNTDSKNYAQILTEASASVSTETRFKKAFEEKLKKATGSEDVEISKDAIEALKKFNESGTQDAAVSVEIVFAPDFMYYNIYTQDDIDNIRTKGLSEAQSQATSAFLSQGGTLPEPGTPVEDIDTILEVGAKFNDVLIAGSIAELAEKIGCDAAVLSETLGGVETTYYAVPVTSWSYGTVGGLDVDVNMNVLREDGSPIANLYAVGQGISGACLFDILNPWAGVFVFNVEHFPISILAAA